MLLSMIILLRSCENSDNNCRGCWICGNNEESMMSLYNVRDSIGIIHLNTGMIYDTEVRAYDDYGNEIYDLPYLTNYFICLGEGSGCLSIEGHPDEKYSEVSIYFRCNDEIKYGHLSDKYCDKCITRIESLYFDVGNQYIGGFCLIDFRERRIYPLYAAEGTYHIRRYQIKYGISDDHVEIKIIYCSP